MDVFSKTANQPSAKSCLLVPTQQSVSGLPLWCGRDNVSARGVKIAVFRMLMVLVPVWLEDPVSPSAGFSVRW